MNSERITMRLLILLVAVLGLAPSLVHAQGSPVGPLFGTVPGPPPTTPSGKPIPSRQRGVNVNFQRLRDSLPATAGGNGATNRLRLNLFPDTDFEAVRSRTDTTDTGYVWVGKVDGESGSQVTLAVTGTPTSGTVMSGSVVSAEGVYSIRFAGNGSHVVEQVNLNDLPPEGEPLHPPLNSALAQDSPPSAALDDGSRIDLLVVYTPAARIAAGGTAAIQSMIDLGVSETNQAYANSGAIQRIRLRRKEEIAYTEAGFNMVSDLSRLTDPSDGYLDAVHSLRTTYAADVVQLVENSADSCGYAWVMDNETGSFASNAFSVIHYTCISPNYSMAHELGHNMGLRHDAYVDQGGVPLFGYARGYVNQAAFPDGGVPSQRWRDIMSYNDQCSSKGFSCTRLLYFSNPSNLYPTSGSPQDPMGIAGNADARQALDNTRDTVANFRAEILEPLDNFPNARFIFTNNFSDSLVTDSFTTEGTDPTPTCGGGVKQKSAWYRFTPGVNGVATIDTAGSSYDTIVSAYTGTSGSFTGVGCNDDSNSTLQSRLVFSVTAGTTYSVMISAKSNDGGTLILNAEVPIEKRRRGQLVSE